MKPLARWLCKLLDDEWRLGGPFYLHKASELHTKFIEPLEDKIEGLEADLEDAVRVCFEQGATEYVRLNYHELHERFINDCV